MNRILTLIATLACLLMTHAAFAQTPWSMPGREETGLWTIAIWVAGVIFGLILIGTVVASIIRKKKGGGE